MRAASMGERFFVVPELPARGHTVPYGTVPFEGRSPRHFVPGYDRAVPPGQKPFAHRRASNYPGAYGWKAWAKLSWPLAPQG
jgi:hypothetical protein